MFWAIGAVVFVVFLYFATKQLLKYDDRLRNSSSRSQRSRKN
jgi:hypothetical protein